MKTLLKLLAGIALLALGFYLASQAGANLAIR